MPTEDTEPGTDRSRSLFERHGLSTLDVLMLFAVGALGCMYTPFFYTWFWAPRMLVMIVVVLPGLVALTTLAFARNRAAACALGVAGWSVVSAAYSDSFAGAFSGFVGQELSVVSLTGALGFWALAQFMSDAGRRYAVAAVIGVLALNAILGLGQMLFQLEGTNLSLHGGRSVGLTANSVYFGALMAMGAVMCIGIVVRTGNKEAERLALVGTALFAVNVSFSGSRVALGAVVIVVLCMVAIARAARVTRAFAVVLAGLIVGVAVSRSFGVGSDAGSRLTSAGDSNGRSTWWNNGWEAFKERPVLGWGLGRFRTAIQGRLTFDDVAAGYATEAHWDAHNVLVSMAVAIGLPGLVLLSGFAFFALRSASWPFALAGVVAAMSWLLQPVALTTLPLVLFVLAISSEPGQNADVGLPTSRFAHSRMLTGSLLVGLLAAAWLGVAEIRLASAVRGEDARAADRAASMYFRDPIVSGVVAQEWIFTVTLDQSLVPELLDRLERSTELEPTRALWWAELARVQGIAGDVDQAEASARRALSLQPTHPDAWRVLVGVAAERDDFELLATADGALCRLGVEERC